MVDDNFSTRTDNGELLNLIDATGCPVNELIFPALNLEEASRALAANFKAFRFPSTPTVNFVATVQFCQDVCDPVSCTGETYIAHIDFNCVSFSGIYVQTDV